MDILSLYIPKSLGFQYSGWFNSGSFNNQGTAGNGNFWSSTVNSATNSHNLWFSASGVNPANNNNKGNGFAVRCVADSVGTNSRHDLALS